MQEKISQFVEQQKQSKNLRIAKQFSSLFIERIFFYLVRVFNMQELKFEEQLKWLLLIFVATVVLIILLGFMIIVVSLYQDQRFMIRDLIIIGMVCTSICFLILLRLFFRFYQIFVFLFNSIIVSGVLVAHFVSSPVGGVLEGQFVGIGFISIIISIVFGDGYQKWFWVLFYSASFLASFIYDIIVVDIMKWAMHKQSTGAISALSVVFHYTTFFIPMVVCAITLFYYHYKNEADIKIFERVGQTVLALDFEDDDVEKLEKKGEAMSNRLERLLKIIIGHLRMYKAFLPDSIKLQKEFTEDDDLDISNSDGDSTTGSRKSYGSSNSSNKRKIDRVITVAYGISEVNEFAMMRVTLHDFSSILKSSESDFYVDIVKKFTNICTKVIYDYGGSIDDFGGSYLTVSFNTQVKCINFANMACSCAFEMMEEVKQNHNDEFKIIASLVFSRAPLGHLKTIRHSKFLILGDDNSLLYEIDKISEHHGAGSILIDDGLYEAVRHKYLGKGVDLLIHKERNISVFRLMKERVKMSEKEKRWMFEMGDIQLDRKDRASVTYHEIFEEIKKNNFEKSKKMIDEYSSHNRNDREVLYLAKKVDKMEGFRKIF